MTNTNWVFYRGRSTATFSSPLLAKVGGTALGNSGISLIQLGEILGRNNLGSANCLNGLAQDLGVTRYKGLGVIESVIGFASSGIW